MHEFTKSLLANHTSIYRYGGRDAQVWGSLEKKSVAKYAVKKGFTSFTIKIVNICLNFYPSKMITRRNVPNNFLKVN